MKTQAARALAKASESDLAGLARQGDRAAFGELVRRTSPVVVDLLRRMGAQPALAEDLTQDALIAALGALPGFREEAAFTTWVVRIAARLYLKRVRSDARTYVMAEPAALSPPAGDAQLDSQARLDLDRALGRLSKPERLCVALCHGAGMTHEEIASSLGVPLGTVKSHVLRGMKKLRALMLSDEGTG